MKEECRSRAVGWGKLDAGCSSSGRRLKPHGGCLPTEAICHVAVFVVVAAVATAYEAPVAAALPIEQYKASWNTPSHSVCLNAAPYQQSSACWE